MAIKLIEIAVTVGFLLLMINVILPWAGASLADGFLEQMRTP